MSTTTTRTAATPAPTSQSSIGPLAGVVVADFTHILSGPFCTQMLADAGATVIKIEQPGGEYSRVRGQLRRGDDGTTLSSYYAAVNRDKQSVWLDLKNADGLQIAKDIIDRADVVVENFAPGVFARLGIDFAELRAQRPELVTCSISLFGGIAQAGELATRGGLSVVAEAESSCGGMLRDAEGTPLGVGIHIGDMGSGMAAFGAICAALFGRERSGEGRHLDISMVRACLALNSVSITAEEVNTGKPPLRDPRPAGWGIFGCSDGYVAIGINSDSLFHRLAQAMGNDWMITDPRYANYAERDTRVAEVNAVIGQWSATLTTGEVIDRVAPRGVPIGLVATPRDILESPIIERLGFLYPVDDGMDGILHTPANACGYQQPTHRIPRSGEHGPEILQRVLGVDAEACVDLAQKGAFGTPAV